MNGKIRYSFLLIIAVSALLLSIIAVVQKGRGIKSATVTIPGLLEQIDKSGVINAGYGVYPPYTMEDPNTKKVTGFSVDVMEEIAKQLNVKVVWHRINWNTMSADIKRGEFDIIADPIFQTIPRAREFSFSQPYAYFSEGIAVVKKGDNRFKDFKSLDRTGIIIAVGRGWASETFVRNTLSRPEIKSIQTSSDLLQVFNEVVTERADVAISDGADAERYVKEHSDVVKALWLENPPTYMAAGFALRFDDTKSAAFVSVALQNLESLGILKSLKAKYNISQ